MNSSFCNICTLEGSNYPVLSASQFWEQESFACLVNALVKCKTCSLVMCYNCIQDGNERNPGSVCYQRCGTSLNPLDTYNDIKYQNFQIEPQSDNDCIRQSLYKQEQVQLNVQKSLVSLSNIVQPTKVGRLSVQLNISDVNLQIVSQDQETHIQTTEDQYISEDKSQIDINNYSNIQQQIQTNVQIIDQKMSEISTQIKVQMFTRKFINTYKKQISNIDIQINESQVSFDLQLPHLTENREIVNKKYTVKYNLQILQGITEQQDKVTSISFNQLPTCGPDHDKTIQDSIKQFIRNNINKLFNKYMKGQLITLNTSQIQFICQTMQNSSIQGITSKTELGSTLTAFKDENLAISCSGNKVQNDQQLYQTKLSLLRMGLTQQFVDLIQYRLQEVNVTSTLVDCYDRKKDSNQGIYIQSNNSNEEDQKSNSPRSVVLHDQCQLDEHPLPLVRSISQIPEYVYQDVEVDSSLRCDSFKRRKVDTESDYICDENDLYCAQDSETSGLIALQYRYKEQTSLTPLLQESAINGRPLSGIKWPSQVVQDDLQSLVCLQTTTQQDQNCALYGSPVYIQKRTYLMRKEQVISNVTVKLELLKQIKKSTYDQYRNYAKSQMIHSQDKIDPNSQEYINMQHSLQNLIPTLSVCVYYKQ